MQLNVGEAGSGGCGGHGAAAHPQVVLASVEELGLWQQQSPGPFWRMALCIPESFSKVVREVPQTLFP